jgi:hypothetical protein
MNQALPRQRRLTPPVRHRAMFEASWYSTPIPRRSTGVRPVGVKWNTNSWQSFTNRGLLIGL